MARPSSIEPLADGFQGMLLDAIGEAVIATTPEGKIVYWNAAAEGLYGWPREEVLGKNVTNVTPSPARAKQAADIMDALKRGKTWRGEFDAQRKDGSTFPALMTESPVFDDEGGLEAIIRVSRDLTEKERLANYLEEAQEIAGMGIWEFDPVAYTFWASEHKRAMLGLPPNGFLSFEQMMERVLPKDRERLQRALRRLLDDPTDHRMQYTIKRPDGEERIIDTRIRARSSPDRGVVIYGTSQDVTQEEQAREARREKARKLAEAERVGQAGSWSWDIKNDAVTWSLGFFDLLGLDPDDVPILSYEIFLEHVHPDDRDHVRSSIENALKDPPESPYTYEFRAIHPNGRIRWLEARSRVETDEAGDPVRLHGFDMDITEKKRMETRLLENQKLLDETQRIAHTGSWAYDLRTGSGDWSDEFYRLLGYDPGEPAEPTAQDFIDRVHPEDIDEIEAKFEAILEHPSREPITAEHRIQLPDGTIRWLEARYWAKTQDGEPVRLIGKSIDITKHRELEEKLEDRLRALERRNVQIERVSMASSHPVREAVRETRINLQRLMETTTDRLRGPEKEALEAANAASGHLEGLLESFREYVELAARPTEHEAVDLEAILENVLRDLEDPIEVSDATVTSASLPTAHTGKMDISKVLHHLILNAITYAGDAPPRVHVDAERNDDVWIISIQDQGIGIDPEYHERIFQPFMRLHARSEIPGAGLGLAVSRWIIEDLGGTLWCRSKSGEGATFYFTLPSDPPHAP